MANEKPTYEELELKCESQKADLEAKDELIFQAVNGRLTDEALNKLDPQQVNLAVMGDNRNLRTLVALGYQKMATYAAEARADAIEIKSLQNSRRNWRAGTVLALLLGAAGGVAGNAYVANHFGVKAKPIPVVAYSPDASQPQDAGAADAGDYIARSDLEAECRSAGFSKKSSKKPKTKSCEDQGYIAKEDADAKYVEATLAANKKAQDRSEAGFKDGKESVDCTHSAVYRNVKSQLTACLDNGKPTYAPSPDAIFKISNRKLDGICGDYIDMRADLPTTQDRLAPHCKLRE